MSTPDLLWIDPSRGRLPPFLQNIRQVADAWNPDLPGEIINKRGNREVLRLTDPLTGKIFYLKRWCLPPHSPYRFMPGAAALRSRAQTEFHHLQLLKEVEIMAPIPVLLGVETGWWGPVASLLVVDDLYGYLPAQEWIRLHSDGQVRICRGIAEIMGTLHRHNLYYRSPGLKHFFIHSTQDEEPLALIDVPRIDCQPSPLKVTLGKLFGTDPPTVERDLSKVLITLQEELRADTVGMDLFWETYLNRVGRQAQPRDFRQRIETFALQRLHRRRSRV